MADDAERTKHAVHAMIDALQAAGIINNSTLSLSAAATLVGALCAASDDPEAMLEGFTVAARLTIAEIRRAPDGL